MNDVAAVVEGITDKLIVEKSSGVGHIRLNQPAHSH